MKKNIFSSSVFILVLFSISLVINLGAGEQKISVKEIIEKNIAASGGKARIDSLTTLSFDTESTIYRRILTTYYAAGDGRMKIVVGDGELVENVTVVDEDEIGIRNFAAPAKLTNLKKAELTCFAGLCGGGFTLKNFKDRLRFSGIKRFGPETHYVLTTRIRGHDIDFYIDTKEHTLKRIVFKGSDEMQGGYKSTYDFGQVVASKGLKIPSSWFKSFIGPKERNDSRVNIGNIKTGIQLEKGFFKTLDINFGRVRAVEGYLEGNVIASRFTGRKNVVMTVNWTPADMDKAGFKTRDKLKLNIGGSELEVVFLESSGEFTPRDTDPGNKNAFLVALGVDRYLNIVGFGESYKPYHEKFKKLSKVLAVK